MAIILGSRSVLAVKNLEISSRFFMDILGFQEDPIKAEGWCFLSRDGYAVMLGECADAMWAGETGDHSYFVNLRVSGIDELYEEFCQSGATAISRPTNKPWGLREFSVQTPDGHRMMFIEPYDG